MHGPPAACRPKSGFEDTPSANEYVYATSKAKLLANAFDRLTSSPRLLAKALLMKRKDCVPVESSVISIDETRPK